MKVAPEPSEPNPAPYGGTMDDELATQAYAFAYPLVTMGMTRPVTANVEQVKGPGGPVGQLRKDRLVNGVVPSLPQSRLQGGAWNQASMAIRLAELGTRHRG